MTHETLDFELENGLASITLNRPDVLNSMNEIMLRELLDVTEHLSSDASVRAVLLTGTGRGFCAGADLAEAVAAGGTRDDRGRRAKDAMVRYYNPIALNLSRMPKPVVCAVNGIAAGGGVGLALSCDVVFAAQSAAFVQVFVPQLGIIPDVGSTWFLPRLLGNARAMGLMLSGEKLSAQRAEQWGLIWKCCEDEKLMTEAAGFAQKLAQGPTQGIASTKQALQSAAHNNLEAQLQLEADVQRWCCASEDAQEGFHAFVEKRQPHFKGR